MLRASREIPADGPPALVSISTRIDAVDPLWIFSRLGGSLRFYWEQPDRGLAIVGAGSAAGISVDDAESRYGQTAFMWRGLLAGGIVDAPAGVEGVGPIFAGGYSFDSLPTGGWPGSDPGLRSPDRRVGSSDARPHRESILWAPFPAAKFFLPRFSIAGTTDGSWLTYNRVVNPGERSFAEPSTGVLVQLGLGLDEVTGDRPNGFGATLDLLSILREAEPYGRGYGAAGVKAGRPRGRDRVAMKAPGYPGEGERRTAREALPGNAIWAVESDEVTDLDAWTRQVNATVQTIRDGRAEKVVLARRADFERERPFDPASILAILRREYRSSTVFAFGEGEKVFLGASPERLVRKDGAHLEVTCLAGSIGRSEDEEEDREKIAHLLGSAKDRSEHDIVVRAIRDALAPIADRLEVPESPRIATFRNLHHLCTPITATIKPGLHIVDAVAALHPTPAVGGFPKRQALEIIGETETFARGWFAGPVGWMDAIGNGEFSVALRSGLVEGSRISLFAGCGIVRDSEAQQEWRETELKMRPMMSALGLT